MTDDARTICEALGGRWRGHYGLAFCPAHDNRRTPALSLSAGFDGRLLAHCHAGCDFGSILDALRARGLVEGRGSGAYTPPDPATFAKRQAEERAERDKRARQAEALWQETEPIAGTVAERYLREARGITCELPPTLRFHPDCWHASARRFPALAARVDGSEAFGQHRTYLRADGGGKAAVDPCKAMLGSTRGAAARLSDGPGPLLVGEGIESTLSAFILRGDPTARAWAALSTSGMAGLRLPAQPGALVIAPDGDKAGRAAALALADRAANEGWAVSILTPPPGRDFNDQLREVTA